MFSAERRNIAHIICSDTHFLSSAHLLDVVHTLHACTQSISGLETDLKNFHTQNPILQEELTEAEHSYREAALGTLEEHEVEAFIKKAQRFGSKVLLLNKIHLAYGGLVENKEVIREAKHGLAQNQEEMRNHSKNIASLKAERKKKLDKVFARLPTCMLKACTSCLVRYPNPVGELHCIYLHFAGTVCRSQPK